MKIMRLLGFSIAAALLFAVPTFAAASPAFDTVAPIQAVGDCHAVTPAYEAKFFVEAAMDCDVTVAELTGLCVAEVTSAPPATLSILFAEHPIPSCILTRPSPPG